MKRAALVFFMIFVSAFKVGYTQDFLEEEVLIQLHSLHDSSIKKVDGKKYYLNSERISLSDEGLFLCSDFLGPIALERLEQEGLGEFFITLGVNYWWVCNGCGLKYSNSPPSSCGRCGGSSFRTEGMD